VSIAVSQVVEESCLQKVIKVFFIFIYK